MPYVMVPVPEEHVQDVMQFVLREVAKASLEPWDEVSGKELSEAQAAGQLQLRQREMAGILRDLNERATKANHPALISTRTVTETLPNGRTTEKRVLWINEDVAPLVHGAERAELANVPEPLDGSVADADRGARTTG